MLTIAPNPSAELAAKLLTHYSFDLSGYSASELITLWQREYPISWLHLAVIEALYQGRYKAISVQQILIFWTRRDQASYHFNMEFERMICSKFPERLNFLSLAVLPPVPANTSSPQWKSQSAIAPQSDLNQHRKTQEKSQEHRWEESGVSTSPSFKIAADSATKQLALVGSQKQVVSADNKTLSVPMAQMLLASSNNPPIGQFTPEKSDRSELFTSKLKAMTSV